MLTNCVRAAVNFNNHGVACIENGRHDEAMDCFRAAIKCEPHLPDPHKNLGLELLLLGQYHEGFQEYDWRWLMKGHSPRPFLYPLWRGEKLNGPLLVWCEQGLGDEILQASMLDDLLLHGVDVIWETEPRLMTLVQRSFPTVRVVQRTFPPVDMGEVAAQIPAYTLGYWLRSEPWTAQSGYLKADQKRYSYADASCVGVSWTSRNPEFGALKSIVESDRKLLTDIMGLSFAPLDHISDIENLANFISKLNLVITVSNTIAHLACALGVETWVMVPAGERLWYWGTEDKTTTPWYPSARLFRQKRGEPWGVVLDMVAKELGK